MVGIDGGMIVRIVLAESFFEVAGSFLLEVGFVFFAEVVAGSGKVIPVVRELSMPNPGNSVGKGSPDSDGRFGRRLLSFSSESTSRTRSSWSEPKRGAGG